MLRISGGIDLVCAPEDGENALVMSLDKTQVSALAVLVSGTTTYKTLAENTYVIKAVGAYGLTDISNDISLELSECDDIVYSYEENGSSVSFVIAKGTQFTSGQKVCEVDAEYTLNGVTKTITKDVYLFADGSIATIDEGLKDTQNVTGLTTITTVPSSTTSRNILSAGTYFFSAKSAVSLNANLGVFKDGDLIRVFVAEPSSVETADVVTVGELYKVNSQFDTLIDVLSGSGLKSISPDTVALNHSANGDYLVKLTSTIPIYGGGNFISTTGGGVILRSTKAIYINGGMLEIEYLQGAFYVKRCTCLDNLWYYESIVNGADQCLAAYPVEEGVQRGVCLVPTDYNYMAKRIYDHLVQYIAIPKST